MLWQALSCEWMERHIVNSVRDRLLFLVDLAVTSLVEISRDVAGGDLGPRPAHRIPNGCWSLSEQLNTCKGTTKQYNDCFHNINRIGILLRISAENDPETLFHTLTPSFLDLWHNSDPQMSYSGGLGLFWHQQGMSGWLWPFAACGVAF